MSKKSPNQLLRETYHFSASDLLANRQGRLSARQQARQQAILSGIKLSASAFGFVLLGTIGLFVLFSLGSGSTKSLNDPDFLISTAIVGVIMAVILLASYFPLRKQIAAISSKTIQVAEGEVQRGRMNPNSAHFEIKIGGHTIRLQTTFQLEAFKVGSAYRIYYLKGATPTILSAEVIGSEAEENLAEEEEQFVAEEDVIIQRVKKGRKIVIVLTLLVLGAPLVLFASGTFGGIWQGMTWVGLMLVSFLFVVWALR
ncbi:MAG: hypothetical protein ACK44E_11905 [Anaerolineales bacterium]